MSRRRSAFGVRLMIVGAVTLSQFSCGRIYEGPAEKPATGKRDSTSVTPAPSSRPQAGLANDDFKLSCTESEGTYEAACARTELAKLARAARTLVSEDEAKLAFFHKIEGPLAAGRPLATIFTRKQLPLDLSDPSKLPDGFRIQRVWSAQVDGEIWKLYKTDLYAMFADEYLERGAPLPREKGQPFAQCNSTPTNTFRKCEAGFEPADEVKGILARAMFYSAVAYDGMTLSDAEEAVLRKWNSQYPVTEAEFARAAAIQKIQGNENPFVHHPSIMNKVKDL